MFINNINTQYQCIYVLYKRWYNSSSLETFIKAETSIIEAANVQQEWWTQSLRDKKWHLTEQSH